MRRAARAAVAVATASLSVAVVLGASSVARAERILAADVRRDGGDAVIALSTTGALGEPRVRVGPGRVRLWFPGADEDAFFDAQGDGAAVRRVMVRPGSGGTGLVEVTLGRGTRTLTRDDVRVEAASGRLAVRIAYAALGVAPPGDARGAAGSAEPTASSGSSAGASPGAPAPTGDAPSAAGQTAATGAAGGATGALAASTTDVSASSAAPLARRTTTEGRAASPSAFPGAIAAGTGPGLGTLVGLALVLGAALLGARWMQRRQHAGQPRPIEVVASHRLGAKHQLVVVRAFDQEILLSVQGTDTRRIAARRVETAESGREPAADDGADAEDGLRPPRASGPARASGAVPRRGGGLLAVSDGAALPSMGSAAAAEAPAGALASREPPTFGRELARALSGAGAPAAVRPGPALRLVGGAAPPASPGLGALGTGPLVGAAARLERAPLDGAQAAGLARAAGAPADSGAESVTGLLRLRHAERS
jgi:flagellar biogenesis protein FliO